MRTLDDEILFVFRLIKRQSKFQKQRVFNPLKELPNYIITDDLILFLTQPDDSKEPRCKLRLRIDDIYGTLRTDRFLYIIEYHAFLFILNLKDHKLYYWEPAKDNICIKLMLWETKTRIETLWLKLLNKIKRLMPIFY